MLEICIESTNESTIESTNEPTIESTIEPTIESSLKVCTLKKKYILFVLGNTCRTSYTLLEMPIFLESNYL